MNHRWFKPWGWIFRPVSAAGFLITVLLVAFWLQTFVAVDRHSHSVSDTLYGIFPFWVGAATIWYWIASKTH